MYLGVGKNQSNPWVYVDDSDPSIKYSTSWLVNTGLQTDLSALTNPESINTPLYGTLHSTSSSLLIVDTYSFWYVFNGTDFAATFRGGKPSLFSNCTVDGVKQTTGTIPGGKGTLCWNEISLSAQTHNLSVSFTHTSEGIVSFDGLAFNPSTSPIHGGAQQGVDMVYPISFSDQDALLNVGGTLQFQFDGVSVGIYADITSPINTSISSPSSNPPPPSSSSSPSMLSYTIDSSPPTNFTIERPSQDQSNFVSSQLILQTPPLSRGPHTLTLTTLSVGRLFDFVSFSAIVQNSTRTVDLTPVPSILSSTSSGTAQSSQPPPPMQPSSHQMDNRIVIGVVLTTFLLLILIVIAILWLRKRRLQKRAITERANIIHITRPFPLPDTAERDGRGRGGFMIAQYVGMEKTSKYRQAFSIRSAHTDGENHIDLVQVEGERNEHGNGNGQSRRIRYRVHEDGGEAMNAESSEEADDEEYDVISLPPIYDDTIQRTHSQPNHTSRAIADEEV